MSQYIVLSRIKVQNANCIAGFTWGFPAITHFLGFTHALHRKIAEEYDIALGGCAVVSHEYQLHVYKPSQKAGYEFIQSRNPPVLAKHKNGKKVPTIEEGKMNLTTSIIIEVSKELIANSEKIKAFKQVVLSHCLKSRLAGGTILSIGHIALISASTEDQEKALNNKIKRLTIPGFVLQDRSDYLKTYFEQLKEQDSNAELLTAWLDFSAMKYQAQPEIKDKDKNTKPSHDTDAEWLLLPKPQPKGWLVPIMTGYKAISRCYEADEINNTRKRNNDSTVTYTRFVEAAHSVGEWLSLHRMTGINDMIWRYQYDNDWYLCVQNSKENQSEEQVVVGTETMNFEDALENL